MKHLIRLLALIALVSGCGPAFAADQGLIASGHVIGNGSPSTRTPTDATLTSILDQAIGSTRGSIVERGSSAWAPITPRTSGYPFVSNGAASDPAYQLLTGAGIAASTVANSNLVSPSTTVNGVPCTLGSTCAVTATAANALTIGTHLTGGSYNGSSAVTIGTDATSANTASAIMARDGSGNVSVNTLTGAVTGHASLDLAIANNLSDVASATTARSNLGVGPSNTQVYYVTQNGLKCDGVADDTSALNALLATVETAGGGTIYDNAPSCLIMGQVVLPNGGGNDPIQASIRITGSLSGTSPYLGNALNPSPSVLDLRYNGQGGPGAKIVTYGAGKLEIDHVSLIDGGSDCSPFLYTTNTAIYVHDNYFQGASSARAACNDAIITGGTSTTIGNGINAPFQGYGSVITANTFNQIRRGWLAGSYANGLIFRDNTFAVDSGSNLTKLITAATNASPGVLTVPNHNFAVGQTVYRLYGEGFTGSWTPLNGNLCGAGGCTVLSSSTIKTDINTTSFGSMTGTPGYYDGPAVDLDGGGTYEASGNNAITAASWSGGQVTFTTTQVHGILPGEYFTIAGMTPSGYNGDYLALAGTTQSTLVASLASNPGSATVLGNLNEGGSASGNVVDGNLIEGVSYGFGIRVANSGGNTLSGNGFWDTGAQFISPYDIETVSQFLNSPIETGYAPITPDYYPVGFGASSYTYNNLTSQGNFQTAPITAGAASLLGATSTQLLITAGPSQNQNLFEIDNNSGVKQTWIDSAYELHIAANTPILTAGYIDSSTAYILLRPNGVNKLDYGVGFTTAWDFHAPIQFDTDNAYSIGTNGNYRPSTIYAGTAVISPSMTVSSLSTAGLVTNTSAGLLGTTPIGTNVSAALGVNNIMSAISASSDYFTGAAANLTMTGTDNTASGYTALVLNSTGSNNSAFGYAALYSNVGGNENSAIGFDAGVHNTGSNNTFLGAFSSNATTSGAEETSVGMQNLYDVTTGMENTAIGFNTGRGITTGSYNTILGASVTGLAATLSNAIILSDGQGNIRANYGDTNASAWTLTGSIHIPGLSTNGLVTVTGGLLGSEPELPVANGGTGTIGTYTYATLPTPSAGMRAFISDAAACTFLSAVAGGGSTFCPVYYTGSSWNAG